MASTDALSTALFSAKAEKRLTFADLAKATGRDEVAVAAIFYGSVHPSADDIRVLSEALNIPHDQLKRQYELRGFPNRGAGVEMPPKEPLIYRLYEIVMNYGQSYKAVLNEKFGDGIVSAIAFSTKVEKEVEEDGSEWAVITLRGKWLPFKRF